MYCLSPPMEELPRGDWFCPNCVAAANDASDFGFNSGKTFTMDDFEKSCRDFDEAFFGGEDALAKTSTADIEEAFWKMVEEGCERSVDVHHGGDVDVSANGGGFPRRVEARSSGGADTRPDDVIAAAEHAWNLNNIPRQGGEHASLLRQVTENVPGITTPLMHVGSTFSSFCWRYEDHMLYSINYNHAGAAKTWYGVPGASADAFEESFKQSTPDLFAAQPDLVLSLVTMLSPSLLQNDGVPVYRADQKAGEFVVTFPKAYHAGFNCGFNVSEEVCFAPPDWLRFGNDAVERYRFYRKPSVLCHDELACVVAADDPSAEVAKWLVSDIKRITHDERAGREQLFTDGVVRSKRYVPKKLAMAAMAKKRESDVPGGGFGGGSNANASSLALDAALDPTAETESVLALENANGAYDRECTICRYILHCSGVACSCNPNRPACLRHSAELCDCPPSHRVMFYRKSIAQLERLCNDVERASGKRSKASDKEKAFGSAKARQKRAAAWVKKAKETLAVKSPPKDLHELEQIMIAAEEFTWAGEDMNEVRKHAAKVGIAIAFQRELAVLKRRLAAEDDDASDEKTEGKDRWVAPGVDDADVVARAAAEAPMRGKRGQEAVSVAATVGPVKEDPVKEDPVKEEEEGGDVEMADAAADGEKTAGTAAAAGAGAAAAGKKSCGAPARRMTLDRLRELLNAAPFPLPPADADAFAKALETGEDLESRVVAALDERPYPNPKKFAALLAEVARGPLEVTSARRIKDAVAAAHAWADAHRKALPGRRHRPARADLPTTEDLLALKARSAHLPVQPNDVASLDAAVEETNAWAARATSLMATTPSCELEDAKKLLEQGAELPCRCDEMDALESATTEATTWAEEAVAADNADAPLNMLWSLHESATGMCVRASEELRMLVERIRVREWADPAKLVAVGKPKPSVVEEIKRVAAQGAAIIETAGGDERVREEHVTDAERQLLEKLRACVENGEAWEKRAKAVADDAAAGNLKPLEDLEKLVAEAQKIPAALTHYKELFDASVAARSWVEKAQLCLKGKQLTRRGANAPPPTLAHAERLIRDAGKFSVSVKELGALEERVEDAKAWGVRAEEVVDHWREDGAEQKFEQLLIDHESYGLELPAAADVRACLAALAWEREARDAVKEKDGVPTLELLEDLRTRADDIDMEDIEDGLGEDLMRRLEAVEEWTKKVDEALRFSVGAGGSAPKTMSAERAAAAAAAHAERRPQPEIIKAFIDEGKKLPAIVPRVAELETILDEHQKWVESARALLGPPKPKPTPEELRAKADADAAAAATAAGEDAAAAAAAAAEAEAERKRQSKNSKKKKKGKGGKSAAAPDAKPATAADAKPAADEANEKARIAAAATRVRDEVEKKLAARAEAGNDADTRPAMADVI